MRLSRPSLRGLLRLSDRSRRWLPSLRSLLVYPEVPALRLHLSLREAPEDRWDPAVLGDLEGPERR